MQMSYLMSSNPRVAVEGGADAGGGRRSARRVRGRAAGRRPMPTICSMPFRHREDYDPGPGLEKIKAPLVAINSADDLINPPELGILEREIKRVPRGRAIIIPLSDQTQGHGTHTVAAVWKEHLAELLQQSDAEAGCQAGAK